MSSNMDDNEERSHRHMVELALMVARPGVRLGAHPALVLAREVRALRADVERLRVQLGLARANSERLQAELEVARQQRALARRHA
jgi:hypothetical protein